MGANFAWPLYLVSCGTESNDTRPSNGQGARLSDVEERLLVFDSLHRIQGLRLCGSPDANRALEHPVVYILLPGMATDCPLLDLLTFAERRTDTLFQRPLRSLYSVFPRRTQPLASPRLSQTYTPSRTLDVQPTNNSATRQDEVHHRHHPSLPGHGCPCRPRGMGLHMELEQGRQSLDVLHIRGADARDPRGACSSSHLTSSDSRHFHHLLQRNL